MAGEDNTIAKHLIDITTEIDCVAVLRRLETQCIFKVITPVAFAGEIGPRLATELCQIWNAARTAPCYADSSATQKSWIDLMLALADRDATEPVRRSVELLNSERDLNPVIARFLLQSAMLGILLEPHRSDARSVWQTYAPRAYPDRRYDILSRVFMASAGIAAE